ncbi:MAG: prolipoprotein diacylglyceryl transferase [Candidatus Dependentiae bacterium]
MCPEILPIYGQFAIQSYGLALAFGLLLFCMLVLKDPRRKKLLSSEQFINIVTWGMACAIIGARTLHIIHEWESYNSFFEWFMLWHGGLSFLGGLVLVLVFIPLYLRYLKIPILPFLDLVALYAPIPMALGRIGCLLAGCCCGIPTTLPWGITFTSLCTQGQLCIPLHPTQLYSAIALFIIFLMLKYIIQLPTTKPGQLFCSFIILVSLERFLVDFFRADREVLIPLLGHIISIHQLIAIALCIIAIGMYYFISHKRTV